MKKFLFYSLAIASLFSACKKTETEYIEVPITDKVDEYVDVFLKRPELPSTITDEKDLAKKQLAPAVYDPNTKTATVVYENGMVANFENIDLDKNSAVLVKLKNEEKTLSKELPGQILGEEDEINEYEEINLMSAFYMLNGQIPVWVNITTVGNGKDAVVDLSTFGFSMYSVTIPASIAQIAANALSNACVVCPTSNQLQIDPKAINTDTTIIEIPFWMLKDKNEAFDKFGFLSDLFGEDIDSYQNRIQVRWDAALMLSEDADYYSMYTGKLIYNSYQSTMVIGEPSFEQLIFCEVGSMEYSDGTMPTIVDVQSSNPEVVAVEERDHRDPQMGVIPGIKDWYATAKKAGHATITATFYYKGLKYVASRNIEVKKANQEDLFFNFIKYQPSGSSIGKAYYTDNSGKIIHSTTISYEDEYNFGLAEGEYYNNIFREISNLNVTYDSEYFDKFELVEGESMFSVKAKRIEGTTNVIVEFDYCGLPVELNQEIEVKQRY